MNTTLLRGTILIAAITLALSACGENSSKNNENNVVATGKITGFGSVYVNGVKFETDSARFDVDDDNGTQNDLSLGMVVTVTGSIDDDGDHGEAIEIDYDEDLEGPISSVPVETGATKSFTVLGTTVVIDAVDTVFDNSSPGFGYNNISQYDVVEVSGFYDADGVLHATYIQKEGLFDPANPGNTEAEATGIISGLSGSSFMLGNLQVSFDSTTELDDLPEGGLANGLRVEVKGTIANAEATAVNAIEIENERDEMEDHDGETSLEGYVSDFSSLASFVVNGINVDASSAVFSPASLENSLGNNIRIEVEGRMVDGTLVAKEIELED
jgi:Domain of unknown function (DUF5666)